MNVETPVQVDLLDSLLPLMEIAKTFDHEQLQAVALLINSAAIAQSSLSLTFDFSHQSGSVGGELRVSANFRRYDVSDNRVYKPGPERNKAVVDWTTTSGHTVQVQIFVDKCSVRLGDDQSNTFYPRVRSVLEDFPGVLQNA